MGSQFGWAYCKRCAGLFYGTLNYAPKGVCPAAAGKPHDPSSSIGYRYWALYDDGIEKGQNGWRLCNKCAVLFYADQSTQAGRCPAGSQHVASRNVKYVVRWDDGKTFFGLQNGWRWCQKCRGLFFSPQSVVTGTCPAGGQHDPSASGKYLLDGGPDKLSEIDRKYEDLISTNLWIGEPIGPTSTCPDGAGRYRHYRGDSGHGNASIYWTPQTGAHLVYGLIRNKWAALGWEKGPNGYPTTDEQNADSGRGRYNNFQNGCIIWRSGQREAFSVQGAIYQKWAEVKWDWGELGFPTTDELLTPCGNGRYSRFEHGDIYWSNETGAHVIKGLIGDFWKGPAARSRLQYPTSDELVTVNTDGKGRRQGFQGGVIYWTPDKGCTSNFYPVVTVSRPCPRDLHAGQVDATKIGIEISSDGVWEFHAHLHDNSTWYGDSYAIGFAFSDDGHGSVMTGKLGAQASGPAVNADLKMQGKDPWIADCWSKVKDLGIKFSLRTAGDPASALGTVVKDSETYGPKVIELLV